MGWCDIDKILEFDELAQFVLDHFEHNDQGIHNFTKTGTTISFKN